MTDLRDSYGKHRRRAAVDDQPTERLASVPFGPPDKPRTVARPPRFGRGAVRIFLVVALLLTTVLAVRNTAARFDTPAADTAAPVVLAPPPIPVTATEAGSVNHWQLIDADNFDQPPDPARWNVYDGFNAASQETWDQNQCVVRNGVLTMVGAAELSGRTCGMASLRDQQYGRWEVRARFPGQADVDFNPVLLLWPAGAADEHTGEIDFAEIYDPNRQYLEGWIHGRTGKLNVFYTGKRTLNLNEWHNYAVEWQPDHIAFFIDGIEIGRYTDAAEIPNLPMHLVMQLGFSRSYTHRTGIPIRTTTEIDWARTYR